MINNKDYEALLHEIKNAISVISCSLQLIERQHPQVKDYAFWEDTTSDLSSLRELLLDVSNMQLCDHPKKKMVNIKSFLQEVSEASSKINKMNYPLIIGIDPCLTEGYFDAYLIQHALLRLLDNAFDALYEDGMVILRAYPKDNGIIFEVTDNGRGITEEALPQIFRPFFGSKSGNNGLGLPISKGIAESHSGSLTLRTELGKGTTFSLFLPLS